MFLELFLGIFATVYTLYIRWIKYWNPMPEQLFSYKDGRVLIHGYIAYSKIYTAIEFFELDGTYNILLNDKPMRTYIDGAINGSDPSKTYVLHANHIQCQCDTKVIFKDILTDNEVGFHFESGEVINFVQLSNEL